jgi:hypothetical protein
MDLSTTQTLRRALIAHAQKTEERAYRAYPAAYGRLTAILTAVEDDINFHARHGELFTPEDFRAIVDRHLTYLD